MSTQPTRRMISCRSALRSKSGLALRVQSAIVPSEFNLMIDSDSKDLARCSIGAPEPFTFDPRLLT
jgi:hypothetical protein